MQTAPDVPLIGGSRHGQNIQIDQGTIEIKVEVYADGEESGDPTLTETYQRRIFSGEEFGEGFECFVLKSDDETEQRELARWSIANSLSRTANGVG